MNWLLAGLVVVLPTYLVRFSVVGIPTTLLELLIYGATIAGGARLIQAAADRDRLRQRLVWLLPASLLLLGAAIGVIISPDTRLALGLFKGYIVDPILVYTLLLAFVEGPADIVRLVQAAVVSGSAVALLAIGQAGWLHESRALGLYHFDAASSPNYLAFALAPLVPVLLIAVKRPWLRIVTATVLLWALALTGSRAGLAAAVVGLGIAILLSSEQFWKQRSIQFACLAVLLVGLIGSWFVVRPDFAASPVGGGRVTSSNNIRWQIWGATGELVRTHPLTGVGLGNYQRAFGELTNQRVNFAAYIIPEARSPHNLAVGLWTDAGLLGLSAFFVGIVLVGRALIGGLTQSNTWPLASALIGSWFVILAHGLVDMPIWKNDLMILFWLMVASAAVLAPVRKPSRS